MFCDIVADNWNLDRLNENVRIVVHQIIIQSGFNVSVFEWNDLCC